MRRDITHTDRTVTRVGPVGLHRIAVEERPHNATEQRVEHARVNQVLSLVLQRLKRRR